MVYLGQNMPAFIRQLSMSQARTQSDSANLNVGVRINGCVAVTSDEVRHFNSKWQGMATGNDT
jgi:hypothetical protein